MVHVNTQDSALSSSDAQNSKLAALESKLNDLKATVEKENRGVVGWAKRWGAVVALIVAFVAVPRGLIDLYHILWGSPHTELFPGNYVTMDYNPASKSVSFVLGFGLENSGTKDDFVSDWGATIKNISLQAAPALTLTSSEITCSSQGIDIMMPYPLHTATPISLSCKLQKSDGAFLPQSGTYEIEVNVSGATSKKQSLSYCFDLGDKVVSEVNGSAKSASKTILKNPDCTM